MKQDGIFSSMQIPGLNAAVGLGRFDDDEESYLLLLNAFSAHAMKYVNTVRSFLEKLSLSKPSAADIADYRIAVHSLKGSNRSIGAEELGDRAADLETAAKQENLDFIAEKSSAFADDAEKLITALIDFLQTIPPDAGESKPEKEDADPALLAAIRQAAEDYNMQALSEHIETLDKFTYPSKPGLADWLREQLDVSNFDEIVQFVDKQDFFPDNAK